MKIFLFVFSILLLVALLFAAVIFTPVPPRLEHGPRTQYRVFEGAVEVYGLKNDKIQSLLGTVRSNETFVVPTISGEAFSKPLSILQRIKDVMGRMVGGFIESAQSSLVLSWIEPLVSQGVGRAQLFMYKESKHSTRCDFTVICTNETIRPGFVRALERTHVFSDIQLDFSARGFSFFCRAIGISFEGQGIVSTIDGAEGKLFLQLDWLKIASASVSKSLLRNIEKLFENAYVRSGNFPIKLRQITFKDGAIALKFRKTTGCTDLVSL